MARASTGIENEYQEFKKQALMNFFDKFEFSLSFKNMNYEELLILNNHLLNEKYNDVYKEIIKNNEINEKLSLIFIAYSEQGVSEEEIFAFIKEQIIEQVSENFLIKKQTQEMMEEIKKFDFENAPSTSTGIYHLPYKLKYKNYVL